MSTLLNLAKELEKSILFEELDNTAPELERFAFEKQELPKLHLEIIEVENITSPLLEYSILVLWWFSSTLIINHNKDIEFLKYSSRLILLCSRLGIFDFGCKIGEYLVDNDNIYDNLCRDSFSWHILLNYAKCLRRIGKYENAYFLYARIAEKISKNDDMSMHAQLLLNMGKAAHNHQWRTGYSLCLTIFATRRFQLLLDKEPIGSAKYKEYSRFLAICLDSQAMITFEVKRQASHGQSNLNLSKHLQIIWKNALGYAERANNYNSEIRIRCRSSFVKFQLTENGKDKLLALNKFHSALKELEAAETDQRGLAVRFRQYAEMLAQLDSVEYENNIKSYLIKSVQYAQNEKDWRTKATNQITLSKIYFNSKYSDTKYTVEQIKIALRVLKLNLNERLPELEVDANLELARQFRSIGDYRESKECLIKAYDVVLELEKRLFSDLEAVLSSQRTLKCSLFKEKNTYAPMCLLTRSEKQKVREALFSDFQLLSVILHKVANDRLITADLAAGQTATELQLGFYQDCLRGHAHSFKNIIERLRIGIKRANIDDHFKIHPLYQALENTVRQVEGKFSELLVNNNSLITSFVSVRSLVKKMISENNYSSIFEGVSFRFDNSNSNGKLDDFSICCCPKIFENVLENLIINAARAALNSSICGMKEVKIRVLIESGTNGERSFGIFEVEDTGGDVQKLQQALKVAKQESPQNSEDRETFGLPHAVKFLQGFNGQVEVHGFQKKYTTLKIKIPIGQRLII